MIKIPGLIDPHVHIREPGATHKEDWDSGTSAALAGGFTIVLAMPNTQPAIVDAQTLKAGLFLARQKARCDYAQYLGASEHTAPDTTLVSRIAGVKMYLNQTYGPLRLDDMSQWMAPFASWPKEMPIAVHAEGHSLGAIILMASLYDRPVHLCHIARKDEIQLVRAAKEKGIRITCEVAPHHLFLCDEDIPNLGTGRSEVRPTLGTYADQQALWENLDVIDCFASDHAPHTSSEKDGENPPPGFPGLETTIPLLLTAISEGRMSIEDLVTRCYTNPKRIFNLPEQVETWVEIDPDIAWEIKAEKTHTRSKWTPFENFPVKGKVKRVVLRGVEAYNDGKILVDPGFGINLRE
ncbi:MAG: amidohydrolase family protein [Anaerolineaceae bacterium]|nr:amidohydrolase family protein [Anaerolineaceae bacterium]